MSTRRFLPLLPQDGNPFQPVATVNRSLEPVGSGGPTAGEWITTRPIQKIAQDGTLLIDGIYVPCIGVATDLASGQSVDVIYNRKGPVAVIANRMRRSIPGLRKAVGGVVEELFLAPVDDTFRYGIWFRNDQQCRPLTFPDPEDVLQRTVQVWRLLEDGEVESVTWGEGGSCFFIRRFMPVAPFFPDTTRYYICTLDRQHDVAYGTRRPRATLKKTLTLTEALVVGTVELAVNVNATVGCPILSRTAEVGAGSILTATRYNSYSASMLAPEPTYSMTVGRSVTIVDDSALSGGEGEDTIGCSVLSDFLTKELEIVSILYSGGAQMAPQPFAEPRISADGQTVTWPTRLVPMDSRRYNEDFATSGDVIGNTPSDIFLVNRSTRTVLWTSCAEASRSLTGTIRHPAHTAFNNIRAGKVLGGTSEDTVTPARGTCILDADASAVTDFYVGMQLLLVKRTEPPTQLSPAADTDKLITWGRIAAYNGSSKTATLEWGSGWISPTEAGATHYAIWSSPVIPQAVLVTTPTDQVGGVALNATPLTYRYRDYASAEVDYVIFTGGPSNSPVFYGGMQWRGFPLALIKTTCSARGFGDFPYARRANKTITITNTGSGNETWKIFVAEPPASFKILAYGVHAVLVEGNATRLQPPSATVTFLIGASDHNDGAYTPGGVTYNAALNQSTIAVTNTMNTSVGALGRLAPTVPLIPAPPSGSFDTLDDGTDWRLLDGGTFAGLGPGGSATATYTRDDLRTGFRWWTAQLTAYTGPVGGSSASVSITFDPTTQYEIGFCPLYTLTGGNISTTWDPLLVASTLSMGTFGSTDLAVVDTERRLVQSVTESLTTPLALTSGLFTGKLGLLPSTVVDFTTVSYVLYGPSNSLFTVAQAGLMVKLTGTVNFTAWAGQASIAPYGLRFGRRLFLVGSRAKPGGTIQATPLVSIGIGLTEVGDTAGPCYTPGQASPVRMNFSTPASTSVYQTIAGLAANDNSAPTVIKDWLDSDVANITFRGGTRQHAVWSDDKLRFTTFKSSMALEDLVTVEFNVVTALDDLEILNPDFLWHDGGITASPLNPKSWFFKSWQTKPATLTLASPRAAMLFKVPDDLFPSNAVRQVVNDKSILGLFTYRGP